MQVGAERRQLLCFLEGIEVPCISAALSGNLDAPATCVVQCIPTAASKRLLPRTSIHVFTKRGEDEEPKLFFAGEIVGFQYSKTPTSLAIMYQAVDDSSYWDTAYQYFVDYGRGSDWLFQQKTSFMGTGNALFDSVFREHASVLGSLLRTKPKTYPQLKGLVAGVVSILEAVGGVSGKFKGFNDFFTMAEMRRKILGQISAAESDTTSAKIYNYKVFWQWIMRQLGSVGSMVSMRDMLKLLFSYIFHHVVPNPIAKYDPPGERETKTISYRLDKTAKGKEAAALIAKARERLMSLLPVFSSFISTAIDKTRSAIVKNPQFELEDVRKALSVATSQIKRSHEQVETKTMTALRQAHYMLKKVESSSGIPESIKGRVAAVRHHIEFVQDTMRRTLAKKNFSTSNTAVDSIHPSFWEDMFLLYGPSEREVAASNINVRLFSTTTFSILYRYEVSRIVPTEDMPIPGPYRRNKTRIDKMIEDLAQAASSLGVTLRSVQDVSLRERLHTQIIRPDLWFAAAPKCNVIFPDEYISFQYGRSYLQEVTRMELTTAMELAGSNSITNSRYFAPNIQDITGKYTLQSARGGVRLIMPHEVYVGILPQFQFQSEANIYAARSDQKKALATETALLREQAKYLREQADALRNKKGSDEEAKTRIRLYEERAVKIDGRAKSLEHGGISYIQRAVNYMFFKQRFMSRTMGISGLFLPRVVAGFPGVVIDRPSTAYDIKPSSYIGDIAGFQHTYGQEGGTSQFSFQTPREVVGVDDEFLGLDGAVLQTVRAGRSKVTTIVPPLINKRLKHLNRVYLKGSPILKPTQLQIDAAARAKDEILKIKGQLDFIRAFEQRKSAGLSFSGLRGPNGGPVTSVKATGTLKQAQYGKGVAAARKRVPELKRLQGGIANEADVQAAQADLSRQLARDDNWLPEDLPYRDKYVVTESYSTVTRKIHLPVEEQLFPSWLSPIYRNENIGKEKIGQTRGPYQQFFGCGAITDDPGDSGATRAQMEKDLQNGKVVEGPLRPSKTIEEAVDEIATIYERMRDRGLDVLRFIEDYTYRPVATLTEILGSEDLVVDAQGNVATGTLGFHTFAFGDYNQLEGLEGAEVKLRGATNQQKKVASGLDVRKERRNRVLKYREELDRGQGQRGA